MDNIYVTGLCVCNDSLLRPVSCVPPNKTVSLFKVLVYLKLQETRVISRAPHFHFEMTCFGNWNRELRR